MNVTKEEFLDFIRRLLPFNSKFPNGRTITFEISEDEKYNNFLQKMFKEEFENSTNYIVPKQFEELDENGNKYKPYYRSVTIAGQLTIKLDIK